MGDFNVGLMGARDIWCGFLNKQVSVLLENHPFEPLCTFTQKVTVFMPAKMLTYLAILRQALNVMADQALMEILYPASVSKYMM